MSAVFLRALAIGGCLLQVIGLQASVHAAQAYPSRPVRVVNPYAPGGMTDLVSRLLAQHLSETWGQQVIVDNRPGAGANVGTEIVVRAAGDGYTLLCTTSAIAVNQNFYPKLPFNAQRDLVPVVLVAHVTNALVVYPGLPARSVRELIDLARAKPGQLTFASAGTGSAIHLALEMFKALAKVDLVHVPYKGGGPALADVIGGQISGFFNPLANVLPHAKSGRLRILAITGAKRYELAPELPTIAESGVPGYEANTWSGLFAPKSTPRDIVGKWNAEVNRIIAQPEVRERFLSSGMVPVGGSAREFGEFFSRDIARWAELIRAAGIAIEQ